MAEVWTFPTLACGHVADAASVCICSTFVVAAQRKSPKQPLDSKDLTETETVNSPQPDPTTQTRTNLPFVTETLMSGSQDKGFGRSRT